MVLNKPFNLWSNKFHTNVCSTYFVQEIRYTFEYERAKICISKFNIKLARLKREIERAKSTAQFIIKD